MKSTMPLWKRITNPLTIAVVALCCLQGWDTLQAQTTDFQVSAATRPGDVQMPLDAAPDLDGATIYFTATGPNGPGVFRVPATGGAVTEVVTGRPFVAPTGLALSSNGQQIYVADPHAWYTGIRAGQLFLVSVRGGMPVALAGAEGTEPRGLDVVSEGGRDMIYFTGKDPSSGEAAVFKIPASGGTLTVVAKGSPLVEPEGLAVTRTGIVYVADRAAAGVCFGSVFKIDGSIVTKIVDLVRAGHPAGVALSLDESLLLVSALQPYSDHDQLLLVHLNMLQAESFTSVIGQNRNNSGGVHRARNRDVFAWACGRVYFLFH